MEAPRYRYRAAGTAGRNRADHVLGSTAPVRGGPITFWNATTAWRVSLANLPLMAPTSECRPASRAWRLRTAGPGVPVASWGTAATRGPTGLPARRVAPEGSNVVRNWPNLARST